MILRALYDLYGRLATDPDYNVAAAGYSSQKIAFKVVLDLDGKLVDIQDARDHSGKRPKPVQLLVPGQGKPSGSGINPCTLWDNPAYMLGYKKPDPKDKNPERTAQRTLESFEAFRERVREVAEQVAVPELRATQLFLGAWDPAKVGSYAELLDAATGFGVFQLAGEQAYVHQHPEFQRWWAAQDSSMSEAPDAQCLVTGGHGRAARIHNPKIKGVIGGKAEKLLVSYNEPAYESYGKSQSHNAPVSEDATFRYCTALNALLDGPMRDRHRILLGDTTVAFWTEKPTLLESVLAPFLSEGSRIELPDAAQDAGLLDEARIFLQALRRGREAYGTLLEKPARVSFYLLCLSANSARVSVRFFVRGSVLDLLERLRQHHRDIGLVPQPPTAKYRGDPEFASIRQLLSQTAREEKDIPPTLEAPLFRAVFVGAPYPHALFAAVLRRIRADRRVDYLRCCILKGYLNRNLGKELPMSLDTDRRDPAYRLGRLFSALEKTQRDALGKINASIRERFYSSASANPGVVFPRLLRTYQHHLAKIDPRFKTGRERLVQEILDSIEDFPTRLSLPEQGSFALGYYHQTRSFFTPSERPDSAED